MMDTDSTVTFIGSQREEGVMVPRIPGLDSLREALDAAAVEGLCVLHPWVSKAGPATRYVLTEAGFRRFCEIQGAIPVFT